MAELIITEKPAASLKIANALAEGKITKHEEKGAAFYSFKRKNKDILVGCAVGHLYTLAKKDKKYSYPVFDIEWQPNYKVSKAAAFTKKYADLLKKISKKAKEFTVACDYDIEGEVIGLNVIRFICNKKDANRMKFSTLTKDDVVEAYENKSKHIDWGQANAGETRHYLDYFYGINLSRALMAAVKSTGRFSIMSIGRVQGPALKIIVDREKEIQAFEPVPFWQIELNGKVKSGAVTAWHKKDKFWEKKEAQEVLKKTKGKDGKVTNLEKKEFQQSTLTPFDLTTLQTEAYRCFGINPKDTLATAQKLYLAGLISYPRTSSQKLPASLGFKKIINALAKQKQYVFLAKDIMSTKLIPNEGKKSDPAHPSIFPTGEVPKRLDERQKKVYDLIVKRFFTVFAGPATRETVKADIDVNSEIFIAKGTRTTKNGWHDFYKPYVNLKEEELPPMKKGDDVKVEKITMHDKETQPPRRYTQASLVRELEKRNLGTKATRASVVDTLYQRAYIQDQAIKATQFGISTIETLEKYSPEIIDENLTRSFEDDMEEIRQGKTTEAKVLDESKKVLIKTLDKFKKKEKNIGKGLIEAQVQTRDELSTLGPCINCKDGLLQIRRGKFGYFAACNKYPDCKTTFSLPSNALVKPAKKVCEHCKHPIILVIKKAKRPQEVCLNPKCPEKLKGYSKEQLDEMKAIETGKLEKTCPNCKVGKMKVRKSVYGSFIACDRYPKCRYVEQLTEDAPQKKDFKTKKKVVKKRAVKKKR